MDNPITQSTWWDLQVAGDGVDVFHPTKSRQPLTVVPNHDRSFHSLQAPKDALKVGVRVVST